MDCAPGSASLPLRHFPHLLHSFSEWAHSGRPRYTRARALCRSKERRLVARLSDPSPSLVVLPPGSLCKPVCRVGDRAVQQFRPFFLAQPGCLARAAHFCWSSRGGGRCCGVPSCLSAPAGRQCRCSPRPPAGTGALAAAARHPPGIQPHGAKLSLLAGRLDPAWQPPARTGVFCSIEWSSRCVGAAARGCPVTRRAGWRRHGAVHLGCCSRRVEKLRPAYSPGPSRQLPIAPICVLAIGGGTISSCPHNDRQAGRPSRPAPGPIRKPPGPQNAQPNLARLLLHIDR